jgi:hypothetical protein
VDAVTILGWKFTWYHPNGLTMSCIDNMIISKEWVQQWGSVVFRVLSRDVSYHCSLLLERGDVDWGPRLFQFSNFWLENLKFKKVVEEMWSGSCSGWMRVVLISKLRVLKAVLRVCSKVEYGNMDTKVDKLRENIVELDLKGEVIGLDNHEVTTKKFLFRESWKLLKCKDSMMVQRARL